MSTYLNTRLRIKRGDTAPAFRAQCRDGDSDVANLTGASAKLLRKDASGVAAVLPLVVEEGTDGWVHHDWQTAETVSEGTWSLEVEVTYADQTVQTFPGGGYATLEILPDLG